MKRIASIVLAAFLTCGFCESAWAQMNRTEKITQRVPDELTAKDIKEMQFAAKKEVYKMNKEIEKIANKKFTNREKFIRDVRKRFINYCLPYFDITQDDNGNILEKKKNLGVVMEVASATGKDFTVKERLMRVYLYNLMRLNYKSVTIRTTDLVNMKSTKPDFIEYDKNGNEVYKCLVTYVQHLDAKTYENIDTGDLTTKTVECYITRIEILDINNQTDYTYSVKLGNVYVDKLEKTDPSKTIELLPDEDNLYYYTL